MTNIKSITSTIIFEASALNRDEKLGGNIPSIKKITRNGKEEFSYLSRVAIRHYLYSTLNKLYQDDWKPADCISDDVIQFDLTKVNILLNAEMDAFGYMYTKANPSLTRKASIGITKAIALESWKGDMQFNANHDLVKRANIEEKEKPATPNPVNKEEHLSYFKVSFTLDTEKLGYDEWFPKSFKFENNVLNITLAEDPKDAKNPVLHIVNAEKETENSFIVKNKNEVLGKIEFQKQDKKSLKAIFTLDEKLKKKRISQIISTIKNGLIYHASGENYGIVPKFIIASALKLPIPIFNSYVERGNFDNAILENDYIEKKGDTKLVYVQNNSNLVRDINTNNTYSDWNKFLIDLGIN